MSILRASALICLLAVCSTRVLVAQVMAVKHPQRPLFRTHSHGQPIVSEAGYVALADEGPFFVYWTARERRMQATGKQRFSSSYGKENWGQIETFSCLHRGLADFWGGQKKTMRQPIRLHHISGQFGGFPDLAKIGRSSHLSHQTGQQVNVLLIPNTPDSGRVWSDDPKPSRWNIIETQRLMEVLLHHGAFYLVTHRATGLLETSENLSDLAGFPRRISAETKSASYHYDRFGRLLLFPKGSHNHADHVNVLFWPWEVPHKRTKIRVDLRSEASDDQTFAIASDPRGASVFLDGTYVGETANSGPLGMTVNLGTYQIRVSRRDCDDFRATLVVKKGIQPKIQLWSQILPTHPMTKIKVGQIVRSTLGVFENSPQTKAPKRLAAGQVLSFFGKKGQRRTIISYGPGDDIEIHVVSPTNKIVKLKEIKWVSGLPSPGHRLRWTLEETGLWRIVLVPKKAGASYTLGFEKALPDFYHPPGKPRTRFRLPGHPEDL